MQIRMLPCCDSPLRVPTLRETVHGAVNDRRRPGMQAFDLRSLIRKEDRIPQPIDSQFCIRWLSLEVIDSHVRHGSIDHVRA